MNVFRQIKYLAKRRWSRFNSSHIIESVVVVLVDMQTDFLRRIDYYCDIKSLISNQKEIIKICAKYNIPLIIIEYIGNGDTKNELKYEASKVKDFRILMKTRNDGFSNPEFLTQLREWGADALVLMGINADVCVKETAASALNNGFEVVIAKNLIDGGSKSSKKSIMEWYKNNTYLYSNHKHLVNSFLLPNTRSAEFDFRSQK